MANTNAAPFRIGLMEFIAKSNGSQFTIPVYQRNYTWTTSKDINKLLSDIDLIINEEVENHFVGTIMYLQRDVKFYFRQLQIVDGQQRVTTTFLILLAIRKYAKENGFDKEYEYINREYMLNLNEDSEHKLRLKPLVSDDDTYHKLVEENYSLLVEEEIKSNIYKNFTYICSWLYKKMENHTIEDMITSLNKLHIICVPLFSTDNVQQIFESINSTGTPLTASDLIRNYILMTYTDEEQEVYFNKYWLQIEKIESDSSKLEEIFRFYLGIKMNHLFAKKQVYTKFKEFWKSDPRGIDEKLTEIVKYIKYFGEIYTLTNNSPLINEVLLEFRKNLSLMPAPFLMEMYSLYDSKLISDNTLVMQIKLINNFLVRRSLCDLDTSSITQQFVPWLSSIITECNGEYSNIVEITKYFIVDQGISKTYYMPNDEQLKNALTQNNAYSLRCLRGVLDVIEHCDNDARVDLNNLSIEHIMPQSPTKFWEKSTSLHGEDYTHYANLIGNLTLATKKDNSSMGNNDFINKKEVLKSTSHLKMNEEILKKDSWTKKDIDVRTVQLIEKINKLFPYELSTYNDNNKGHILKIVGKLKAYALFTESDGIIVLSGSEVDYVQGQEARYPQQEIYINQCKKFLEEGKVVKKDGKYVLVTDISFPTVSSSASFVLQNTRNGWLFWKFKDGKSIQSLKK